MVASGFAAMGYQIVWTQQCALWLGHESAAVLAVVAAFFGGLALGSSVLGPCLERSIYPVRWYACCELIMGTWGLAVALLMPTYSGWMLQLTGVQASPLWQWAIAFSGIFVLLLPATVAMGATLPAMERVLDPMPEKGRSIAGYYAANTLGAVVGVLATAFWLVPVFGLTHTAFLCVVLNLGCAITAFVMLPRSSKVVKQAMPFSSSGSLQTLTRLACTGLLGIGYEVLVIRVLSQVTEDTVYTFAMLLAVYLLGTSLGAAVYERWLFTFRNTEQMSNRLLGALAVTCLIGTALLAASQWAKNFFLGWTGPSMAAALAAEAAMALLAFGLPTVVMGALFSHLNAVANATGVSFGRSLGVNTLGAAIAPLVFGVIFTPMLGPKTALLLIAVGYLALTTRLAWSSTIVWVPVSMASALAIWMPPLAFIDVPEGGHVVSYHDGAMAAVSVVEDQAGTARLRINNRQQEGSSATLMVDGRQALLPLLLHPGPQRALFLGLGTGITASVAAADPSLQVDAVELLPEVIQASTYFRRLFDGGIANPRLHLITADARRFVRTSRQRYDVIVADNFHPARSGSGALYTVEHFLAVRDRLSSGGLFCQWLPLHQLDLTTLRSIVRSFTSVYPDAWAILASNSLDTPVLGLIGQSSDNHFDRLRLRHRLNTTTFAMDLGDFHLEDEFALLGGFVAGPKALSQFAGTAAPNTDDHPVVAYLAPRITYAPDSLPRDRLLELLHEFTIEPAELLSFRADPSWSRRLSAYWTARNQYLEAGRNIQPSTTVQEMLSQVREPLLSVLRISPDFRPAYDPLIRMAMLLERTDAPAARALLQELATVQPARPEASLMLHQLTQ
jgi:spermidine synthase